MARWNRLVASAPAIVLGFLCFPLAAGSAFAASVVTTNSSGGSTAPAGGSECDTAWNPSNACEAEPGDTIYDLLRCLAEWIDPTFSCRNFPPVSWVPGDGIRDLSRDPSTNDCAVLNERSDFTVNLIGNPPIGLSIIRRDGQEPEKLLLRENDSNIQWTTLQVNRANLVARIGEVTEFPSGGTISLWINASEPGDAIDVPTGRLVTPEAINQALVRAIESRGFVVRRSEGYIFVSASGSDPEGGIRYVSFRSTDPEIQRSDLFLLPPHMIDSTGAIQTITVR
jgi:hypothetical protein